VLKEKYCHPRIHIQEKKNLAEVKEKTRYSQENKDVLSVADLNFF
jgi:hypothetical protein